MESPSWTATRGGRSNKSLFYRDLSTSPATRSGSLRGELGTPGQAAAAAALWRENAGGIDPPPPPFYTLEDRIEQSPDITSAPDPIFRSPDSFKYTDGRSPSKAPLSSMGGWGGYNYRESTSGYSMPSVSPPAVPQPQHTGSPNWWSPLREPGLRESVVGREGEKDGGSPVAGVVQSSSLLALGPPQDFVRPELQHSVNATDSTEGDEWVTVFG
jgi:nuclear pore complex protein Nup53